MKKVFLSFKFSQKEKEDLEKTIPFIHKVMEKGGYQIYSTFFDSKQFESENWTGKEIMEKAFNEIDNSNLVLFFIDSNVRTQGMLIELGYCLAKEKEIILAIKDDIKRSVFRRQIDKIIEFEDLEELGDKLLELRAYEN